MNPNNQNCNVVINVIKKPTHITKYGWYAAKHIEDEYNRLIYVRSKTEVFVFSTNDSSVQSYDIKNVERLYRDWIIIENVKIEAE